MQIKKINNEKIKIILSSKDLDEKNIDIDSFLSNPIESQNLFFEILDLAEKQYDFDIESNRAIIEAISLDNNNMFILTITKLKNDICTYTNNSKIFFFDNINDLLNLYNIINNNNIILTESSIYKLENQYYFLFEDDNKYLESLLFEFSSPLKNYTFIKDIFMEHGIKIK